MLLAIDFTILYGGGAAVPHVVFGRGIMTHHDHDAREELKNAEPPLLDAAGSS